MEGKQKTILFCPLDWGLGHIARDLPLIKQYINNGNRVIVAASPTLIQWLHLEMPDIETAIFKGPKIRYAKNGFLIFKLFSQLPKLLSWPFKELKQTKKLVQKYKPDLIISDNRYGVRHRHVHSIIITHQLMLKMPVRLKWLEFPIHCLIKKIISPFDECWIPDYPKPHSLAGDLVHKYPLPKHATLIGALSRFMHLNGTDFPKKHPKKHSILAIISGPEPQRTIFEHKIKKMLTGFKGTATIITGKTSKMQNALSGSTNISFINHLPTKEFLEIIQSGETIIARSGYSTIMDMYFLNRKIWLVPTPGQTEQIYLARIHGGKSHFTVNQPELDKLVSNIL